MSDDKGDALGLSYRERQAVYSRRIRCLEHLIDLKRAGHSPKTTELRIGCDSLAVAVMRGQAYGSIGSPSGMCSES